jgi:hypothetical protein
MMAASVAASYAKRILDAGIYRQLEEQFGDRIRRFSKKDRKVVEAILYLVNAFIDANMREDGALDKFVKDVVTDAPSEIGVRLVNGHHRSRRGRHILDVADLNETELEEFIAWYERSDERARRVIASYTTRETLQQLSRLLRLSPVLRDSLITFAIEQEQGDEERSVLPKRIGFLDKLTARMRGERREPCLSP